MAKYDDDMAINQKAYQDAIAEYLKNGNKSYENAGDLGQSAYDNIAVNPQYSQYEQQALKDLEQRSRDGFSARDEADLAQSDGRVNRQSAGRRGALQQNMAARGMGGSGMELMAQLQNNQDATEQQALASLEKNAQVQDGRRQATSQLGQLSGQLSARDHQQQAQKAAAQNQINQFNQQNRQQVMNNNTQGYNQFQANGMAARQGGAQMGYNAAADAANRKMQKKQSKQNSKNAMFQGIGAAAGAIGGAFIAGPPGAVAGAAAGNAMGGAVSTFAHGGQVPGVAPFPGDDPRNDVVPAMLSPGEVVLSREQLDDAQRQSNYADIAGIGAGIGDSIANANNQPQALYNRMQDLGKAPEMIKANQQKTDTSGIQTKAKEGLNRATDNHKDAVKQAFENRKAELIAQVAYKKAATDAEQWGSDNALKTKGHDETVRHNKAMEAKARADTAKNASGFSEGRKAVDKDFAKDYNDYTTNGRPALEKNLKLLKDAKVKLEGTKKDWFKPSGNIMGHAPNFFRPEGDILIQQEVRGAAQGGLRAALGSSFTEKEGNDIMNNSYDPTLSPEANITKITSAIQELESKQLNMESKVKQYETTGSLQGLNTVQAPPPGKITVSNGKETFQIDASDLADAAKDGYTRTK